MPPHLALLEEAESSLALGLVDRAERDFRAALELAPDAPRALHGLARVDAARGQEAEAVRGYERLAREDPTYFRLHARPDYCELLVAGARARLATDRFDPALAVLERMDAVGCRHPDESALRARALMGRAGLARRMGRSEESLRLYRAALSVDPSRVEAYVGAAEMLLGAGRKADAVELLSEGLERHPRDPRLRALMVGALGTP